MFRKATIAAALMMALAPARGQTTNYDEAGVRDLIGRWNAAYTSLDAKALAALETADYEMIDRFGHWIKSEGPEFNARVWAAGFNEIYHGKPGPARVIESIRFMAPNVALVEARANHPDGVALDDGSRIPPFWEINTFTLVKKGTGWRVTLLNIHNQIDPGDEGGGQRLPDFSGGDNGRK